MAFTKILGPGIHTLANFHSHNINSSGIITATKFVGDMEPGGGTGSFDSLTVTGNLGVGGTVTYTDVTNVDAIGIITAQSGIYIGAGATVGSFNTTTGISSFKTLNVDETSTLNGSVGIADSIIHIGNTDTSIRFPSDDIFTVETAGSEALRIQSTGVVNIGDSTASSLGDRLLQIGKTDRSATYAEFRTSTTGVGGIVFSDGTAADDTGYRGTIEYDHGATNTDEMYFKTSALERLRITAAGELQAQREYAAVGVNTFARFARKGNGGPHLEIGYNAVTTDYGYFGTGTAHDLGLRTNDVTRLRITTAGDVQFFGATAGVTSCLWDASANSLIYRGDAVTQTKAVFGNNSDVAIYNKTNFHIEKTGTAGSGIRIHVPTDESIEFQQAQATVIATFTANGSCSLYNNTVKRIETSSTGITVTGEVAATQDYPNFRPTLDLNFISTKTLDPRFEYYRYGPASYVDGNGKIVFVGEDVPRFDHDPVTRECKGLLIEGERRNILPYSFDAGKWIAGSGGTLTRDAGIAPDGTMTATKALSSSNDLDVNPKISGIDASSGNITVSSSVTYTLSVWAKASTTAQIGNNFKVRMKRVSGDTFNPETTFALTGNWARYSVTGTTPANVTQVMCYVGGVSGSEALVWGAQLESGTTASSLIPTYGYTQLRGEDVVQITGEDFTDFYNQEEGTIFLSASYETDARAAAIVTIDDTSNNGEYTEVGYRAGGASSGNAASYIRKTSGGDQYFKAWTSSATEGNEFKVALGYKDDNYASSANGSTVHTDNSGTTSRLYDRLKFSEVHSIGHGGVGHYRRLMYYSKRITDSQLVTLTS